jgi:3-hydroxyisobutyrate dehydrogenase-like beta-hydroxyacid dehydrogenase
MSNKVLRIAVIGAGEMGAAVARRMRECGATVMTSLRGRGATSIERVRRASIEVIDDDDILAREADFILSIVPPGVAAEVAERYRDPILRAETKPIFVECNAIAPATTRRIEEILRGVRFIDAGIIGGPPAAGTQDPAKSPRIYASGAEANELTRLAKYGIDIAVLDGPVGAASALKLAYAGMTKGFIALATAMVNAASREGLADALRSELARTQPGYLTRLERSIPDMFPKAYRWVAEMEQIAEFIDDEREGANIYNGMARLYDWIASERDRGDSQNVEALADFCRAVRVVRERPVKS